jgi:hypothetical protein
MNGPYMPVRMSTAEVAAGVAMYKAIRALAKGEAVLVSRETWERLQAAVLQGQDGKADG